MDHTGRQVCRAVFIRLKRRRLKGHGSSGIACPTAGPPTNTRGVVTTSRITLNDSIAGWGLHRPRDFRCARNTMDMHRSSLTGQTTVATSTMRSEKGPSMSRWWRVVGGISMNLALGTLYAWSVFVAPLEKQFGWKRADTS